MTEEPLGKSLDSLSSFFVGRTTMSETLLRVSELASEALPAAKFVGLTLLPNGKPSTMVFTDAASPEIDEVQYASDNGPCLEAFRSGLVCSLPSTRNDTTWPDFSRACVEHGILSTLSIPLGVDGQQIGAMNMYAATEDAFAGLATELALLFAAQASIVLANSKAYWDARSLSEQLSESIASRVVIEQSKGIIMGSLRCSADKAFEYLVQQSQHLNVKLRVVAQNIVDDVTRSTA